ncbi:hypothetical protein CLOSCI_02725 [[Clostridium] scindens ATCC 35704]|nr:hypothetical protein CLOSCI_02725 [[Clostridium] scindens ATCC 35704]
MIHDFFPPNIFFFYFNMNERKYPLKNEILSVIICLLFNKNM